MEDKKKFDFSQVKWDITSGVITFVSLYMGFLTSCEITWIF